MSDHDVQLTELEKSGLQKHGLPVGVPSQLSDAFRHGVKWAGKENDRLQSELTAAKSESLQAIANKICGEAPEGWVINLCMENGAAWVEAIKPSGFTIDIDGGDQTLAEQLNEALCIATGKVNPTEQEGN